jgi:succinate dehydrogenase/fumarate reductase cytochrome b subunit
MTIHWLDGIRTLNWEFWKMWLRNPVENTKLALLVLAVALRDFFLWVCMGSRYLDDED